jgi:hypothetical protein
MANAEATARVSKTAWVAKLVINDDALSKAMAQVRAAQADRRSERPRGGWRFAAAPIAAAPSIFRPVSRHRSMAGGGRSL